MTKPLPQGFFQDNFDDNVTDILRWEKLQNGGTASETNQQLQVTIPSGSGWAQAGYVTADTYTLFEHTISVTASNGNLNEMTLQICNTKVTDQNPYNEDNWYRIQKLRDGSFNVQQKVNSVIYSIPYGGTGNQLRITVLKGKIYFSDGSELQVWEPYGLPSENCYIYVFTSSDKNSGSGTGSFDNFKIEVIPTTFDESRIDVNCYSASSAGGGDGITIWGPKTQTIPLPKNSQQPCDELLFTFTKPKCYDSKDFCNVTFKIHTDQNSPTKTRYGPVRMITHNKYTGVQTFFDHFISGMGEHDALVTHDIAQAPLYSENSAMAISFQNLDLDVDVSIQDFQVVRGYKMRTLQYQSGDQCAQEIVTNHINDFDTTPDDYPCNYKDCGGMSLTIYRDNHFFTPIINGHQVYGTILTPGNTYTYTWTNPTATFQGYNNYDGKSHCIFNLNNVHLCNANGSEENVQAATPDVPFKVKLNDSPWVMLYNCKTPDNVPHSLDLATHEILKYHYHDAPETTNTLLLQYPNSPSPGVNLYLLDGDSGLVNIYRVYKTKPCCPTITSNVSGTGTIDPSPGPFTIPSQGRNFSMSQGSGYRFSNVSIDGTSNGSSNPYTVYMNDPALNYNLGMEGHTITANFIRQYTVTLEPNSDGVIDGPTTVDAGSNPAYTVTAYCGTISDVIIDHTTPLGAQSNPCTIYPFPNISGDHHISAQFSPIPGQVAISFDVDHEGIMFTPEPCTFVVDGVSYAPDEAGNYDVACLAVGKHSFMAIPSVIHTDPDYGYHPILQLEYGTGTYTCNPAVINVTSSGVVRAIYDTVEDEPAQCTITISAGAHGTVYPNPSSHTIQVLQGGCATFSITPDSGYQVASASFGGQQVTVSNNEFTAENITSNPTLAVTFQQQPPPSEFSDDFNDNNMNPLYWQQVQVGSASCSESGQQLQVSTTGGQGWVQAGYVTANSYSMVNKAATVTVVNQNGVSEMELLILPNKVTNTDPAGQPNWYRIIRTSSNTVQVHKYLNYTFTSLASVYASTPATISIAVQNNIIYFYYGSSQIYSEYYQLSTYNCYVYAITSAYVTGTGAFDNFSIATIGQQQFTITASAGSGGSINPSGTVYVNQGSNQNFTITANSGYTISDVVIDSGTHLGAQNSPYNYQFTNVQTNHTISATFQGQQQGNITRVQGNKRATTPYPATSLGLTLDSAPSNGQVLVAVIGTYASYAPNVSYISQSGVTWTRQVQSFNSGLYGRNVEIWAGVVSGSASTGLTIAVDASGDVFADVCEYSGLATSNFLDQTNTAVGAYTTTLTTGTTGTTSNPNELWVGGIFNVCDAANGQNSTSPTNGFSLLDGAGTVYNQTKSLAYLEKIVSSTGNAASGVTGGAYNTYEAYVGCIATFKGA